MDTRQDLQTSARMVPAAVHLRGLCAGPIHHFPAPCGIVNAHEQQLQPASMVHCRTFAAECPYAAAVPPCSHEAGLHSATCG